MCEANAYIIRNKQEELLMKSVDIIEPNDNNRFRLVGIFGDQITIKANILRINLVDHKILFKEIK